MTDRRSMPKSPEHRQKIAEGLRAYAKRPDSHLHDLHKSGADAPAFKTGIKPEYYRRIAFEAYGRICNRCQRRGDDGVYLVVHHVDEDRHNNDVRNLEVLCMSCHLKHHRAKKEIAA